MKQARVLRSSVITLVAIGLLVACGTPPTKEVELDVSPAETPSGKEAQVQTALAVSIVQMKFQPETLRVHQGDTVVFTNKDLVDHNATALPDSAWASPTLKTGESWSWVADKSTDYFCSLHLVMRGRLEVEK